MLKILQVRLQQYVNQELLFKLNLEKAEDPEIKLPTFIGSQKKWEFQVNIYFCSTDYTKDFDCVDHNKLWKILKEMGTPDHLAYLLRNLCTGQDTAVRTRHGITDWFQIGKGIRQGCILLLCLFNLYAKWLSTVLICVSHVQLFATLGTIACQAPPSMGFPRQEYWSVCITISFSGNLPDLYTDFSRGRSGGLVFPSLSEFSTVCGNPHSQRFWIVNQAEIDVFLELSFFFDDSADIGNLISDSSAFYKTSLNIRKLNVL